MTRVEVIGVYPVEVDEATFEEAWRLKYERLYQPYTQAWKEAQEELREELSHIVIIELLVYDPDENFDLGEFTQDWDLPEGLRQVPYLEAYLSLDGETIVSEDEPPNMNPLRVAFFLHYYKPERPLYTPYGVVQLPEPSPMPERLRKLMKYEPID